MNLKAKPFYLTDEDIQWIEATKASLTLEEKFAQLFNLQCLDMANFSFTPESYRDQVETALKHKIGGFHLFALSPEIDKFSQQALINEMQERSEIPMLLSGDLEKGPCMGAADATQFGTQMEIAATDSEEFAYKYGQTIGLEGTAVGFNWHFGPIIDINYNHGNQICNTRVFSDDPATVRKLAVPTVKGIQESDMAACVKHWPGDGMDDRDQHHMTTINSLSMEEWRNTYKKGYEATIEEGVMSVMSAHIALPAYYEELGITDIKKKYTPGSLSYELNQKLLREELNFNGLIVSDATLMGGMESYCTRAELVPMAIASGIDMFLFTSDLAYDLKMMIKGYEDGVITKQRLDEALTRVLALKASLKLHKKQEDGKIFGDKTQLDIVGCDEHKTWARDCAKNAVTLVKDTQNLLPLEKGKYKKALLIHQGASGIQGAGFTGDYFQELLEKEGIEVTRDSVMLEENNPYDLVIYLMDIEANFTNPSLRINPMIDLFRWYASRVPTVLVSLGTPYALYERPQMKTVVNAYDSSDTVQEEVIKCLFGHQPFVGKSPVDAFCGLEDARL